MAFDPFRSGAVGSPQKVHAGPDAPSDPAFGDLWVQTAEPDYTVDLLGSLGAAEAKWAYGAVLDGKGYAAPYLGSTSVLRIDLTSGAVDTFGSSAVEHVGTVAAPNGMLYGIGHRGDTSFLKIDPDTETLTTIAHPGPDGDFYYLAALADNGHIYLCPRDGDVELVKLNTATDTASTFGTSPESGVLRWAGITKARNGKLYCTPRNSETVLVINPADDSIYTFGAVGAGIRKWSGSILGPNGKIYCFPRDATDLLVIDPSDDTVELVPGLPVGENKWGGGMVGPDGLIYMQPRDSDDLLVVDPDTHDLTLVSGLYPSGADKWTGAISFAGQMFGIPFDRPEVSRLSGSWLTDATWQVWDGTSWQLVGGQAASAGDGLHRLVVLHDFGTGLEPTTDDEGPWLYGAFPGPEH